MALLQKMSNRMRITWPLVVNNPITISYIYADGHRVWFNDLLSIFKLIFSAVFWYWGSSNGSPCCTTRWSVWVHHIPRQRHQGPACLRTAQSTNAIPPPGSGDCEGECTNMFSPLELGSCRAFTTMSLIWEYLFNFDQHKMIVWPHAMQMQSYECVIYLKK